MFYDSNGKLTEDKLSSFLYSYNEVQISFWSDQHFFESMGSVEHKNVVGSTSAVLLSSMQCHTDPMLVFFLSLLLLFRR